MKGCRARTLSWRLKLLRSQLEELRRDALRPGGFGSVASETVVLAISHCMASVDLKFLWVDELPHLVWQVHIFILGGIFSEYVVILVQGPARFPVPGIMSVEL